MVVALFAPVSAQVPTVDKEAERSWAQQTLERFAEYYAVAVEWRTGMVERTNAMRRYGRSLVNRRQRYERMAVGELGTIGQGIPDWRDYATLCAVDVNGQDVCSANRELQRQFEGVVYSNYYGLERSTFARVDSLESDLDTFIGGQYPGLAETDNLGTNARVQLASRPLLRQQMERSLALENSARILNQLMDETMEAEVNGKQLSSGRAKQIAAHLSLLELEMDIEAARAVIENLHLRTVDAADEVRTIRARSALPTRAYVW